jgi:hypothetical protein
MTLAKETCVYDVDLDEWLRHMEALAGRDPGGTLSPMKFFIPGASSPEMAEEIYQGTKKFAAETKGWRVTDARILSIAFKDGAYAVRATVGYHEPCEGREVVVAILESGSYLVCTKNRGVSRGEPYMVGKTEVTDVEFFESGDRASERREKR